MIIEAWQANERAGWEREIAGAWHAAAFARIDKLKPLEEYLPRMRQPVRQQSEAEIMGNVFAWLKMNEGAGARQ